MANFLINSPSSNTVGTNTSDLFDLTVLEGVSIFGVDGKDTITADPTIADASSTRINAGKGADTITLSANGLENSEIFAGMGKDLIITDKNLSSSVIRGGAGKDTIRYSAALVSSTTINGNDMADVISAGFDSGSTKGFLAAGAGKDRVSAVFNSGGQNFSINGGAGHDSIEIAAVGAGVFSALIVKGGNGFDTIEFDNQATQNIAGASNINGNDLADRIIFNGAYGVGAGTAVVGGGAGADTIRFSSTVIAENGSINGGLGKDSIYISASFGTAISENGGTLNGGAGADSIQLAVYAVSGANGGNIFGDEGADKFDLSTLSQSFVSGQATVQSGGSVLAYGAFDESNIANGFDVVSAGVGTTTHLSGNATAINLFQLRTDVVDMSVSNGRAVADFTSTDGFATFTSTISNTVTARVEALDKVLVQGEAVAFQNGGGTVDYVFIQGGASASGTAGDLVVEVETATQGLTLNSVSSISVEGTTV
jgi:hypothetical protein